jgi:hypothetical protein
VYVCVCVCVCFICFYYSSCLWVLISLLLLLLFLFFVFMGFRYYYCDFIIIYICAQKLLMLPSICPLGKCLPSSSRGTSEDVGETKLLGTDWDNPKFYGDPIEICAKKWMFRRVPYRSIWSCKIVLTRHIISWVMLIHHKTWDFLLISVIFRIIVFFLLTFFITNEFFFLLWLCSF